MALSFSIQKGKQVGLVLPRKGAAPAARAPPQVGGGVFGSDDSADSGSGAGGPRDAVRRALAAQQRRTERESQRIAAAAAADPEVDAYDDVYDKMQEERTAVDKARRGGQEQGARFIADMKRTAMQRERERELTDIRIIQAEAERTDHLFKEVDSSVAPLVTPGYARKLEDQRRQWEKDREQAEAEQRGAVERRGFGSFSAHLLEARTRREDEERPDEEYAEELESYLWRKDAERKRQRRERYLELKREMRTDSQGPQGDADALDGGAAEAAGAPAEQEASTPAAAAAPEAAEAGDCASVAETATSAGAAAEGKPEADGDAQAEESTAQRVERLARVEQDRKERVRAKRRQRMQRRNTAEDLDRARDRFLRRRLLRLQQ